MTTASPEREKRHWEFPELEIPEAPLHPEERHLDLSNLKIHEAPPYDGGAPLVPPHRGGDLLGLSIREGPEVALHLPQCLKPLIPQTPEETSRPTSAPSFAQSTVPVQVKEDWFLQDQEV